MKINFPMPLVLAAILVSFPGFSQASTLRDFTFEELVLKAELIFQGSVTDSREEERNGLIYTYIRFNLEEVIKGENSEVQLELRFLGGEGDSGRLTVTDSSIPREGEHGIYFVESTSTFLINPLLGWSQGHYLISIDEDGEEVVVERPRAIESELSVRKNAALVEKVEAMQFGKAAISRSLEDESGPYQLQSFKDRVRQYLP